MIGSNVTGIFESGNSGLTLNGTQSVKDVTITTGTLTLGTTPTLTVTGNWNNNNGTFTQSGGTFNPTGMDNAGTFNYTSGTFSPQGGEKATQLSGA